MDLIPRPSAAGPADRVSLLRPPAASLLRARAAEVAAAGRESILLLDEAPAWEPPQRVLAALQEALRSPAEPPPPAGLPALREAIAAYLAERGPAYDAEREVLVTAGGGAGLYLAAAALLNPGDEVLVVEPGDDRAALRITAAGARPRPVPALRDGDRFWLPFDALEDALTRRTRAILVDNPWRPVGRVFGREEMEDLVELADAYDLLLLSDESAAELVYPPTRHRSLAEIGEAGRRRTVRIHDLGRGAGLAGWSIGWVAAAEPWLSALQLVAEQVGGGPAGFLQQAAAAALTGPQEWRAALRAELAARRELVAAALGDVPGVRLALPEADVFALLEVSALGRESAALAETLLQEAGVAVLPGSACGPAGEGFLCLSFAPDRGPLAEGLRRLAAGLRALG